MGIFRLLQFDGGYDAIMCSVSKVGGYLIRYVGNYKVFSEKRQKSIGLKSEYDVAWQKVGKDIKWKGILFAKGQRQVQGEACWGLKEVHDD